MYSRNSYIVVAHIKIEHDKAGEQERLAASQIPVIEEVKG